MALKRIALLFAVLVASSVSPAQMVEAQQWQRLPETPFLSRFEQNGTVSIGDAKIWYAIFGESNAKAVTLLHGGAANADYWAHLVRTLSNEYKVIVIDSRGHGRSTFGTRPLSYASMADDVIAVLDHLKVGRTAIVGWSDGANIGFYLTLNYSARISGHYAFAGNSSPSGMKAPPPDSAFHSFVARAPREYLRLAPRMMEASLIQTALAAMWKSQPQLSKGDLQKINVPTWVVHAQYDEVIREAHAKDIAASIPNAKFVLLKDVSHFALLQDASQFNGSVQKFLQSLR